MILTSTVALYGLFLELLLYTGHNLVSAVDNQGLVVPQDRKRGSRELSSCDHAECFHIRLYWDYEYYWQESYEETFWCIEPVYHYDNHFLCTDEVTCIAGVDLFIMDCEEDRAPQKWARVGNTFRPCDDHSKCMTLEGNRARLRTCEGTNGSALQQFEGWENDGSPFIITQESKPGRVLNQLHHPKAKEYLYMEEYEQAVAANTLFWETMPEWDC